MTIAKQNVLVTGGAGFIGFFLTQQLLNRGDKVIGIDNLNDYYDVQLKHDRLAELAKHSNTEITNLSNWI